MKRLTSVNMLDGSLWLDALHSLLRGLSLELLADSITAASVQSTLKRITFPAKEIISMLRVTITILSRCK
jgi:hypothetical protein